MDLIPPCHLHRLRPGVQVLPGQHTVNAAFAVARQPPLVVAQVKASAQLARGAVFAFFHPGDAGGHDAAGAEGDEFTGVRIADAVAQRAENPRLRVHEGDGADPGHAVTDPGPDAPAVQRRVINRLYRYRLFLFVPQNGESGVFIRQLRQQRSQALVAGDVLSVQLQQHIALLQAAVSGGASSAAFQLRKAHHHGPPGKQLDTRGFAQWDQLSAHPGQRCRLRFRRQGLGQCGLAVRRDALPAHRGQHQHQRKTKGRQRNAAAHRKCKDLKPLFLHNSPPFARY